METKSNWEKFRLACGRFGKKTGDAVSIQKMKLDISDIQEKCEKDYAALGKLCYEKLKAAEDLTEQEVTLMDAIEEKLKKISDLRVEIATVQNKRYCPQCNTLLDAESNFCSHCGKDMNPACPEVQQAMEEAQEELEAFHNDGAVEEPAEENESTQPAENAETTEEEEC